MLLTNKLQNMVCDCAHHRSQIANDFNGKVVVGKVNVDNERDIAAKYNVRGIPNLLVFNAGEPQEQLVGNVPESQIVDILNKFI